MQIRILHQRKSAGTSLVHTLSDILNIPIKIDGISEGKDNFRMKEVDNFIVSSHLRPTLPNIQYLISVINKGLKVVFLRRNPQSSYIAQQRHIVLENEIADTNGNLPLSHYVNFYETWTKILEKRPNVLFVDFEELILEQDKTIRKILEFYGISSEKITESNEQIVENGKFKLLKKRYTGMGEKELNCV